MTALYWNCRSCGEIRGETIPHPKCEPLEHETENDWCWCNPRHETYPNGIVVIHNGGEN